MHWHRRIGRRFCSMTTTSGRQTSFPESNQRLDSARAEITDPPEPAHRPFRVMVGEGPIGVKIARQAAQLTPPSWRPQGRHPRLAVLKSAKGVDAGPAPGMTWKQRRPLL